MIKIHNLNQNDSFLRPQLATRWMEGVVGLFSALPSPAAVVSDPYGELKSCGWGQDARLYLTGAVVIRFWCSLAQS